MCSVAPGAYREMDELLNSETKGKAHIQLLSLNLQEMVEGQGKLEYRHNSRPHIIRQDEFILISSDLRLKNLWKDVSTKCF